MCTNDDQTGSTDTAVIRGVGRTGRLVTSAALVVAFVLMSAAANTNIKMITTGLGAGIIRALRVSGAVSLFGRWNWRLPATAARLLRVRPSQPTIETAG